MVALIFLFAVAVPLAFYWWLWFKEPSPVVAWAGIYGTVIVGILAFTWASDAPRHYAVLLLFFLALAAIRNHLDWALREWIDRRRRR